MKKKMNLQSLKVVSFVTDLSAEKGETVKAVGGAPRSLGVTELCETRVSCATCGDTCQVGCGATDDCTPPATQNTCNPFACGEQSFVVPGCIIP